MNAKANIAVPFQPASLDIWETKYQLKGKTGEIVDQSIEASYDRVASAIAGVEPKAKQAQFKKSLPGPCATGPFQLGGLSLTPAHKSTSRPPAPSTAR